MFVWLFDFRFINQTELHVYVESAKIVGYLWLFTLQW